MSQNTPPPPPVPPAPLSPIPPPHAAPKKGRWLLFGCGGLIALALIIAGTTALTIWWIQRPIRPVVLSAREKAAVDQKIRRLEGGNAAAGGRAASGERQRSSTRDLGNAPLNPPVTGAEQDDRNLRIYVPGSKVLKLTEREINGLLNANTDLGKSVRLEFAQDAINAYLAVRIPDDFPIGGGKMFRARGRFRVSLGNGGEPFAILEDVTVFGLSLPKAWLGGLKGENLIGQAMGERKQWALKGIKSLRVEPGALVLEVED